MQARPSHAMAIVYAEQGEMGGTNNQFILLVEELIL